jgi:hypothetical protein
MSDYSQPLLLKKNTDVLLYCSPQDRPTGLLLSSSTITLKNILFGTKNTLFFTTFYTLYTILLCIHYIKAEELCILYLFLLISSYIILLIVLYLVLSIASRSPTGILHYSLPPDHHMGILPSSMQKMLRYLLPLLFMKNIITFFN